MFTEDGNETIAQFARCPDCDRTGLLALRDHGWGMFDTSTWKFTSKDPVLWISPCVHRPRWTFRDFARAVASTSVYGPRRDAHLINPDTLGGILHMRLFG